MFDSDRPDPNDYWGALDAALPEFTEEEQHTAVAVYHELAKGHAIAPREMARPLGVDEDEAEALLNHPVLKCFTYAQDGKILGFGGLATVPMPHSFRVGERQLWTWCAWDSLFIPEILGENAEVESQDPETKEGVRLSVSPTGVVTSDPESAVVSFVTPDAELLGTSGQNVMGSFCHFVFFFGSRESGERWTSAHPGTFLYSVEQASELARRLNRRNFPLALESTLAV